MKTLKRIAVLTAIMLFLISQGYSQNAPVTSTQKDSRDAQTLTNPAPGNFVDTNKDGVCDNHQAKMNNGKGANFTDKNGDGICDKHQTAGQGKGNSKGCGMGKQHHHGGGKGNCCGGGGGCGNQHRNSCGNQHGTAPEPQKSK